jgi:hypothetical protein
MLDSSEAFAQVRQGSNIQLLPYPLFIMATGPTELPGHAQGLEPTAAVAVQIRPPRPDRDRS